MMKTSTLRRGALAAVTGLAVSAMTVLGAAGAASAHNFVVSTTPVEGSTLAELPERFDITTNDALLDVTGNADAFVFDIIDSDGLYYGDGCVTVEGTAMHTDAALGEAGTYTIAYQFVSTDGHTVSGEYTFEWAPTEGQPVAAGWDAPPVCGEGRAPTPSAEPTTEQTGEPSAEPSVDTEPGSVAQGDIADELLWVGGAVAVIAVAVIVAMLLLRRR